MMSILIVMPILTLLMFDLGLTLQWSDFRLFVTRPKALWAGLIGQLVALPAVALLLTQCFSLPPVFAVGFVLIACCPGGSSSNIFSLLAGGDVALSVSLTAFSSLITLFTLPIIMEWALLHSHLFHEGAITLPVGKLMMQNLFTMLLPILIGILTRHYAPEGAARIEKVLSKIAFPCLVLLALLFFIKEFESIRLYIGELGIAVLLLILICILLGDGISRLMKLEGRERRTIVIEIGMQNAAQAIALASSPFVFNDARMAVPAIIYALLMNIVLLTYTYFIKRSSKKALSAEH